MKSNHEKNTISLCLHAEEIKKVLIKQVIFVR